MSAEQGKAVEQQALNAVQNAQGSNIKDELNDSQLDRVSAGTSSTCIQPGNGPILRDGGKY